MDRTTSFQDERLLQEMVSFNTRQFNIYKKKRNIEGNHGYEVLWSRTEKKFWVLSFLLIYIMHTKENASDKSRI